MALIAGLAAAAGITAIIIYCVSRGNSAEPEAEEAEAAEPLDEEPPGAHDSPPPPDETPPPEDE